MYIILKTIKVLICILTKLKKMRQNKKSQNKKLHSLPVFFHLHLFYHYYLKIFHQPAQLKFSKKIEIMLIKQLRLSVRDVYTHQKERVQQQFNTTHTPKGKGATTV